MVARRPTASPRLLPRGKQALLYPDHLSRWWPKVAAARYRQAVISCFGDSITYGQYSNSSGTSDEATWRTRGWVPQLRALFADRHGEVGEGIILNTDPRVIGVGQQNIGSVGIGNAGKELTAGDTLTYTLPPCTDIVIYYWWANNTLGGMFTYTVDGGGIVAPPAPSGTDLYRTVVISGLANTAHTLVLNGPATGAADIAGVGCYVNRTSGVVVNRFGTPGGRLNTSFLAGQGASATRLNKLNFVLPAVDLAVITFGTNEGGLGQAFGDNPAAFTALMTDITSFATANGTDCLLIGENARDPSQLSGPYYPEDFYEASKEVARANPHVAYLDIQRAWGTYAESTGLGVLFDGLHPNLIGHSDWARLVFDAIGGV